MITKTQWKNKLQILLKYAVCIYRRANLEKKDWLSLD